MIFNKDYELIANNDMYMLFNKKIKKYYEVDKNSFNLLLNIRENTKEKEIEDDNEILDFFYNKGILIDDNSIPIKYERNKRFNITSIEVFNFDMNNIMNKYTKAVNIFFSDRFKKISRISFYISLFLASAITILLIYNSAEIAQNSINTFSFVEIVVLYFGIFFMTAFHELGHAFKCKKYTNNVGPCGCKLFFLIPILYTDVTPMRSLDKKKKYDVIFAGIYNQIILGGICGLAILVQLLISKTYNNYFVLIFTLNLSSILANLNPFFKYDGYWFVSVYTDTENLYKKSLIQAFHMITRKKVERNKKMILYGISLALFYVFSWVISLYLIYGLLSAIIDTHIIIIILFIFTMFIVYEIWSSFKSNK